jgi:hypothetical protein
MRKGGPSQFSNDARERRIVYYNLTVGKATGKHMQMQVVPGRSGGVDEVWNNIGSTYAYIKPPGDWEEDPGLSTGRPVRRFGQVLGPNWPKASLGFGQVWPAAGGGRYGGSDREVVWWVQVSVGIVSD